MIAMLYGAPLDSLHQGQVIRMYEIEPLAADELFRGVADHLPHGGARKSDGAIRVLDENEVRRPLGERPEKFILFVQLRRRALAFRDVFDDGEKDRRRLRVH